MQAETVEPLSIELKVERLVVGPAGEPEWQAGEEAEPGATLRYRAVCTNRTDRVLKGVEVRIPIPEGVTSRLVEAEPEAEAVSLDGETFLGLAEAALKLEADPTLRLAVFRWRVAELAGGAVFEPRVTVRLPAVE